MDEIPGQFPGNKVNGDLTNGIELYSISWGTATDLSKSGGTFSAGSAKFQTITFTKRLDKATGPLMAKCATGEYIKNAKIYYLRSGPAGGMYIPLKLELNNIVVSGYTLNGAQGGDDPMETICFSPGKVAVTYQSLTETGQLGPQAQGGWDITVNKQV
jgi:type VI secretion system secreted protein Hcp